MIRRTPIFRKLRNVTHYTVRFACQMHARWLVVIAALASSLAVAGYLLAASVQLSSEQDHEKELGAFEYKAGYGLVSLLPGTDAVARDWGNRLGRLVGDRNVMVELVAQDLVVSEFGSRSVRLSEAPWESGPFLHRYRLVSGKWPTHPGEVVVAERFTVAATLNIPGNPEPLVVTGLAEDRYGRDPSLLVAPGTWASFNPSLATHYEALAAQPVVYWRGASPKEATRALSAGSPAEGQRSFSDSVIAPEADSAGWFGRVPAGLAVALLFITLAAPAICFGLLLGRARLIARILGALGAPPRSGVAGALGAAAGVWQVAGAMAGIPLGVAIAYASRPLLERVMNHPADISEPIGTFVLFVISFSLIGLFFQSGTLARVVARQDVRGTRTASEARKARITATEVRRLFGLLVFGIGVVRIPTSDQFQDRAGSAAILTLGVVCLTPDLLPYLARRIPGDSWLAVLIRERATREGASRIAFTVTVTLSVALFISFFGAFRVAVSQSIGELSPPVDRGQVLIVNRSSDLFSPDARAVELAANELVGSQGPIQLGWTLNLADSGDVIARATINDDLRSLLVVPGPEYADRLSRRPSPEARRMLEAGGILTWPSPTVTESPGDKINVKVQVIEQAGDVREIAGIPAFVAERPTASWMHGAAGIVTQEFSVAHGLPMQKAGVLYTGISPELVKRLRAGVTAQAIDPATVVSDDQVRIPVPNSMLVAIAMGLGIVMFSFAVASALASVRGGRELQQLLARIGANQRAIYLAAVLEQLALSSFGLIMGVVSAIPALALYFFAGDLPLLEFPWWEVFGALMAIVGSSLLAAVIAVRMGPRAGGTLRG